MPTNNQSGAVSDDGLAEFTEYFVRNYPGPDTIIGNPNWHAPKIFRAALRAIRKTELDAGGGMSVPFNHRAASADARATTPGEAVSGGDAKAELWRIWAIDGMAKDKQRLAEAAFNVGLMAGLSASTDTAIEALAKRATPAVEVTDDDARDAKRYRTLRNQAWGVHEIEASEFDEETDALIQRIEAALTASRKVSHE